MVKKNLLSFLYTFFLQIIFLNFTIQNSFGDEITGAIGARLNLRKIGYAQNTYFDSNGEFYPPSAGCTNDVCWNSPSMIGSRAVMESFIQSQGQLFYNDLDPIAGLGGDIRYRCRRQKGHVLCFAYRCKEVDPAGCKQMWRWEYEVGYGVDGFSAAKCVDIGQSDGVCP